MKTIAEFAQQNSVTPQTIYRKIDKAVKQGLNDNLTEKIDNVTYITEKGEEILGSLLTGVKQSNTIVKQMLNSVKQSETSEIEEILFLREQIKNLSDELRFEREHSRKQTDELSELAQKLAQITRNQQILLGAEQSRNTPTLLVDKAPQNKKRGFFNFFISK